MYNEIHFNDYSYCFDESYYENTSHTLKAMLDDGCIVTYHTCHSTRLEEYDNQPDKFVYLGYGHIYEIRGVKQRISQN